MEGFVAQHPWLRWLFPVAFLTAAFFLNAKYGFMEPVGLRRAKHELKLAGFEKVSVHKSALVAEIWRCRDQFELKMRVDAFVWKSGSQSGLYCIPNGNRPTKLLLD